MTEAKTDAKSLNEREQEGTNTTTLLVVGERR